MTKANKIGLNPDIVVISCHYIGTNDGYVGRGDRNMLELDFDNFSILHNICVELVWDKIEIIDNAVNTTYS